MANDIKQSNAYLSYRNSSGQRVTFLLWVMEFEQPHSLEGASNQSFGYKQFYPKSYAPSKISVTGRLPDADQHEQLGKFVRDHQKMMLAHAGAGNISGRQIALMTFAVPSEGILVTGFIPSFRTERRRFNPAPEYTFEFEPVTDRNSTSAQIPSTAVRSWWTGEVIDRPVKVVTEEPITDDLSIATQLDEVEGIIDSPVLDPIPGAGGRLRP